MIIKCCKDCADRKIGCHSTCIKYAKEKKNVTCWKDKIHKEKQKESKINEFEKESKKRGRGRW